MKPGTDPKNNKMAEPFPWDELDEFTKGYVEAALWSSLDESDDRGGNPMDKNYDWSDFAVETRELIVKDCAQFQLKHENLLEEFYRVLPRREEWSQESRAGHDYWLTRTGHGSGFWDRDVGDVGDVLSEMCKAEGEVYIYIGDDGLVYISK